MLGVIFGTKAEFIKLKPILDRLKDTIIKYKLIYIKQHIDIMPELPEHEEIQIYDISSNRLDNLCLNILDQLYDRIYDCSHILVQGDTTTSFVAALAAFNRHIKIIHVEAGLRTFNMDNPRPEEFNRRSISLMADIHLCPTNQNAQNLVKEGIRTPKYITGNTGLDDIDTTTIKETNTVLITLHRRENLPIIHEWFYEINKLAQNTPELTYIYPVHPNPDIIKHVNLLSNKNIQVIEPLSREESIIKIKQSKMIITDSGGIQEESNYLRKRVIVCRRVTERPESIWLNCTLCKTPQYLGEAFKKMINKHLVDYMCPYNTDGKASERIIEILKKELK